MWSHITASVAELVRCEDGRTAVEYAIGVNLVALLIIAGLSVSRHDGKRAVVSVCNRVNIVYRSTHDTVFSFARRQRSTAGAVGAAVSAPGSH